MIYFATLTRRLAKRTSCEKIDSQVDILAQKAVTTVKTGRADRWWGALCSPQSTYPASQPFQPVQRADGIWEFKRIVEFTTPSRHVDPEQLDIEIARIAEALVVNGRLGNFMATPWELTAITRTDPRMGGAIPPVIENGVATHTAPGAEAVVNSVPLNLNLGELLSETTADLDITIRSATEVASRVLDWRELRVNDELMKNDEALSNHPCFRELYSLNPQIRTVLSAINRAAETEGRSRNHSVLFGEAGCGKTSTLAAIESYFGPGAVLKLDGTRTTRAGLEKLFFKELDSIPKIVFMEEIEKADIDGLKVWLGALDDRAEIRKVNARSSGGPEVKEVRVLFMCTVNNKKVFDSMMSAGSGEPGALSSRCVNEVFFPRPSTDTLRKILMKEVNTNGGRLEWVDKCLDLAVELNVADPRKVKAFLSGGDRLLDESYQNDIRAIRQEINHV